MSFSMFEFIVQAPDSKIICLFNNTHYAGGVNKVSQSALWRSINLPAQVFAASRY